MKVTAATDEELLCINCSNRQQLSALDIAYFVIPDEAVIQRLAKAQLHARKEDRLYT
jgi:hypothetical protein